MRVSFIHIAFQLFILAYILVYGLYIKKGYQRTGPATGSSAVKIQGSGYSNCSLPWYGPKAEPVFQIWDSYDLRSPPAEVDAAFMTTSMWITRNQTRGECVSYDFKSPNTCKQDSDCKPLKMTFNGRQIGGAGSCMINHTDPNQPWPTPKGGFCKVFGWCPTEFEIEDKYNTFELKGVSESSVFARLDVHYPDFHQHNDNSGGSDDLTPGLNSWTLEKMVNLAGYEWKEVNSTGILLAMDSRWDCDFDHGVDSCKPVIQFFRLDDPRSRLSSGYNFRTVEFMHGKYGGREVTKHYGVRMLILMSGVGSQADAVATLTALGAGIGLLSIATLVADLISTKLLSQRHRYNAVKYRAVDIEDPKDALDDMFKIISGGDKDNKDERAKPLDDSDKEPLATHTHSDAYVIRTSSVTSTREQAQL